MNKRYIRNDIYVNKTLTVDGVHHIEKLIYNDLNDELKQNIYQGNSKLDIKWIKNVLGKDTQYVTLEVPHSHLIITSEGLCYNTYTKFQIKPVITPLNIMYVRGTGRTKVSCTLEVLFKDKGWEYDYEIIKTKILKKLKERGEYTR